MKKLIFLTLILLCSTIVNAQNKELILEKGVVRHKGIDSVYQSFSEAYRTLDVEKVTKLYTENAAYLVPDSEIQQGHAQIRENFKGFFDWVKKENRNMTISFQIFQRKVEKTMAYDVGIYTIRQYKDGKETGMGQGKFVVVALKQKNGQWLFQVDGYSNLKPEKTN